MNKEEEIFLLINDLWNRYKQEKAYFPYLGKDLIGKISIMTGDYYLNHGLQVNISFEHPLTEADIEYYNDISNWINQNFLIRLYSILDRNKIVNKKTKINKELKGCREVDFLRRLRNEFAHNIGKLNKEDKDQLRLAKEITEHFGLDANPIENFPIPINNVIRPIFEGCKTYISAKLTS